jgi:hypothetical protein
LIDATTLRTSESYALRGGRQMEIELDEDLRAEGYTVAGGK